MYRSARDEPGPGSNYSSSNPSSSSNSKRSKFLPLFPCFANRSPKGSAVVMFTSYGGGWPALIGGSHEGFLHRYLSLLVSRVLR